MRHPVPHPVSRIADAEQSLARPPGGGVLVFDGWCGFCTRAVAALLRRDRHERVRALPLQGTGVLELAGLTREAAMREAWWLAADGTRRSGAAAMLAAFSAATGIPVAGLLVLPGATWVADRCYRWVAEHRRLLPGATPHCALDGSVCAPG
jgi:predicted DCC family thiol-disulfide oxidoreductase YuxK